MKSVKEFNEQVVVAFVSKMMDRAASSFSSMCGMEIQARAIEISVTESSDLKFTSFKDSKDVSVLVTPLLGELPGRSYLVLEHNEVDVLLQNSPYKPATGFDETLKEALLKEIDNILSAAVITELANRFKVDVYGDVPELLVMPKAEFNGLINNYVPNGQLSLVCSGLFQTKQNDNFSPRFIWKFSSAIVDRIMNNSQ